MFCRALTPFFISFRVGVLRLSIPGWIERAPAARRARTWGSVRLALVSKKRLKSLPRSASTGSRVSK